MAWMCCQLKLLYIPTYLLDYLPTCYPNTNSAVGNPNQHHLHLSCAILFRVQERPFRELRHGHEHETL